MATYAVSGTYLRSEHMSPPAMAAAVLLHGLVAFALWWLSTYRPPPPLPRLDPIEITIEQPKPPEPAPEPPKLQEPPPPLPPIIEGVRPPAPIESDKPTQVPTPPTQSREVAPPQTATVPEPKPVPPAPAPPTPEPPKPAPPKPEPAKPAPAPRGTSGIHVPPANPLPQPQPSPLNSRPQQQRQAATAPGPNQPAPSPFVNPADEYNRARAQDNYLYQVANKLRGYRFYPGIEVPEAFLVVVIVIARDGRLLSAEVVRSSGYPEIDRGALAGIRQGSPYAPLPDNISGASATFRLPLISTPNR